MTSKQKAALKKRIQDLKDNGYVSGAKVSRMISDAIGYRIHYKCYGEIQQSARNVDTGTENYHRRYYFKEDVDKVILKYTILENMR